jgi:C4-dicarboxylate transporter, DctM subunit
MDPILTGVLIIVLLLLLMGLGVPVAISMGVLAAGGLYWIAGPAFALSTLMNLPYAVATEFAFLVVPMFIFMGALTSVAGITSELYTMAYRWTSSLRGSLYYTTILASGAFGAVNGSTVVSSVLFTKIALPEMLRFGYPRGMSAGCICAAGTFAALIPPSLSMVLYAILTGESVGTLLMAGVLPGILTIGIYIVGIRFMIAVKPHIAPPPIESFTLKQKIESLKGIWALILLVLIVMGGIYSGLMFPSTAGAAGAAGALAIGMVRRKIGVRELFKASRESVSITAVLFLIIIGGLMLSRLLLTSGFVSSFTNTMQNMGLTPFSFMVTVVSLYLILGMFVDAISVMVMTIPFLYAVAKAIGVDPIWFGVIIVKLVEIAAISPPVGFNLFAVISASEKSVSSQELYRGVAIFLIFEFVTMALLLAFPQITLFLPNTMRR